MTTTIIALSLGALAGIASLRTFKKDYKTAAMYAGAAIAAVYIISFVTNL